MSNGPPPVAAVLFMYFVVGSALSFLVGRRPGTLPEDLVGELAMPCVVLAFWVITYSLLDVMAVGQAKHKHNMVTKTYKDLPGTEPEEVYLAQRAQTNQVEQMASFFVSTLMFSVLVNGRIGGLLSLIYLVLRQFYAMTYRAAVGISIEDSGLTKYTIPCYFLLNGMAAAVVVHMTRYALTIA
ncbi:TPR repeat-containing thioredoxin TDX [Durusdinium trenchii]|uniref:TPR repeat-containing thioredoxin TDX n=1 Tax=Durusdinium trenchii TaxID=1381693 RepID=A0ABP0KZD8_9DINO